jgi:hypothetical protein
MQRQAVHVWIYVASHDLSRRASELEGINLNLRVALIHNNDPQRVPILRENIRRVEHELGTKHEIQVTEISYQQEIEPHSKSVAFLRDIWYKALDLEWRKYIEAPLERGRWFREATTALYRRYWINNNSDVERWRRSSAIETVVTDKHVRAWDGFLETRADALIVFEDDAVFRDSSIAHSARY